MHISRCFDNENGAPVPPGLAAGNSVANRVIISAMGDVEVMEIVAGDCF